MIAVPWELFEVEGALKGKPKTSCGVAMVILPQVEEEALKVQSLIEKQVSDCTSRRPHRASRRLATFEIWIKACTQLAVTHSVSLHC